MAATQASAWSGSPALAANTATSGPSCSAGSGGRGHQLADVGGGRLQVVDLARREHDRRPAGGQRGGDGRADPPRGPGDQRDLAVQADLHGRHLGLRRGERAAAATVAGVNRLAHETSPYLRQHADNPVDWYPWGDEAFAAAAERDEPILLSVGYSACHWCHVMAHESFEDADTAALVNDRFVAVKVDREERPDVDAIYMDAVQAMTGQGGWPMTVFLMPDGRPVLRRHLLPQGGPGRHAQLHRPAGPHRRGVAHPARRPGRAGRRADREPSAGVPSCPPATRSPAPRSSSGAYAGLAAAFDPEWGGFGRAPKFPQTMSLEVLLRAHHHNGSPDTLAMVTTSLDAMAVGRHLRPPGRRLRPLLDRRALAGPPLREDALRPGAAGPGLPPRLAGDRRGPLPPGARRDHRLRAARPAPSGRAASSRPRTPTPPTATATPSRGCSRPGRWPSCTDVLGDLTPTAAVDWWGADRGGQLRGPQHPVPPAAGRPAAPARDRARPAPRCSRSASAGPGPGLDDKVLTEWNALMLATLAEAAAATGDADWLAAAVADRRVPAGQRCAGPTAAGCARGRPTPTDRATAGPSTWPTPPTTPPWSTPSPAWARPPAQARWIAEAERGGRRPGRAVLGRRAGRACSPPAATPRRW